MTDQNMAQANLTRLLGVGTFNCNQSLTNRHEEILKIIQSLKLQIILLQDTGIHTRGDETAESSFWRRHGFAMFAKSGVPNNTEYSKSDNDIIKKAAVKALKHVRDRRKLAILVHTTLANGADVVQTGLNRPRIQCIRVHGPLTKPITITNVYLPPHTPEHMQEIEAVHDQLREWRPFPNTPNIIGGDWNAVLDPSIDRLPARVNRSAVDTLYANTIAALQMTDLLRERHPDGVFFTYHHDGHASRIDAIHGSAELLPRCQSAGVSSHYGEDHDLSYTYIRVDREPATSELARRRRFTTPEKLTDDAWAPFYATASNNIIEQSDRVMRNRPPREVVNALGSALVRAVSAAALTHFPPRLVRADRQPFMSHAALRLRQRITAVGRAQAILHKAVRAHDAHRIHLCIQRINRYTAPCYAANPESALSNARREKLRLITINKQKIRDERNAAINKFQSTLYADTIARNKRAYRQFSPKSLAAGGIGAVVDNNDNFKCDPSGVKAATLRYLQDLQGTPNNAIDWDDPTRPPPWAAHEINTPPVEEDLNIAPHDVRNALRHINIDAAPDHHGLTFAMLRGLDNRATAIIAETLSRAASISFFPDAWQRAILIFLHKSGSLLRLSNKRTIGLMSVFLKLIDPIIGKRAQQSIEQRQLLHPMAFGFRPHLGVNQALAITDTVLNHAVRNKHNIYMIFGDIIKAFDKLPWNRSFRVIERMGYPKYARFLQAMYRGMNVCGWTNYGPTNWVKQQAGLIQGSWNAPLVFVCYINPLVALLNDRMAGYQLTTGPERPIGGTRARAWFFADDSTASTSTADETDRVCRLFFMWGAYNAQHLSAAKTTCFSNSEADIGRVIIIPQEHLHPTERGRVMGITIRGPNEPFRTLGIHRSINDRNKAHAAHIEPVLYGVLYHLMRKQPAPTFVPCIINAMIQSVFAFAAPYVYFSKTQIAQFQGVINRVARRALGYSNRLPSDVLLHYAFHGMRPLQIIIDAAAITNWMRVVNGTPDIATIVYADHLDMARTGNGSAPTGPILQRFNWLKRTYIDTLRQALQRARLELSWSGQSLAQRHRHGQLVIWTSKPSHAGAPRSDTISAEAHQRGIIYTTRSIYRSLKTPTLVSITNQQSQIITATAAHLQSATTSHRPPSAAQSAAWERWSESFTDVNHRVQPHLQPHAHTIGPWLEANHITPRPPHDGLAMVFIAPSSLCRPGRLMVSGAALFCSQLRMVHGIATSSAQSAHHAVAMCILVTLTVTDPLQRIQFVQPIDDVRRQIVSWKRTHQMQQANHPYRATMQQIARAMCGREHLIEWKTESAIFSLSDLRFSPAATATISRSMKRIARRARTTPHTIPALLPTSLSLLLHTPDAVEWLEGPASRWVYRVYDDDNMRRLINRPTIAPYLPPFAHRTTNYLTRWHPRINFIWKARSNTLGTGDNLLKMDIVDQAGALCACSPAQGPAVMETLEHLLLHCPLMADLRPDFTPATVADFLGRVAPNQRGLPKLASRVTTAKSLIAAAHAIWKRRCIARSTIRSADANSADELNPNQGN